MELKTTVTKQIDNKIFELKKKTQIRKTLTDLHQNYIVIPIDEASDNVAITF